MKLPRIHIFHSNPVIAFLILTAFFFTGSCSKENGFSPMFESVEASIADDDPDMAMTILDSIEKKNDMRESERMEAAFLSLQIHDRSYKPHLSDSTVKMLLEYYIDGNRNPRLHPSLLYYAGRVYSDLGRDNTALEYLYRAMELAGNHEDIDLESRIYSQTGGIMTKHRLYRKALHYFKKARDCDFRSGDSIWAFQTGTTIAYLYRALNHNDSATTVYRELSRMLPHIKDSVAVSVYNTQAISFLLDQKRYREARRLADDSDLVHDNSSAPSVVSILSRLELEEKNYGNMREYARILLADNDLCRQRWGTYLLMELSKREGDPESALGYAAKYVSLTDSIDKSLTAGIISEQEDMLNEYRAENDNRRLRETVEREKRTNRFLSILCAVLCLVLVFSVFARLRNRKGHSLPHPEDNPADIGKSVAPEIRQEGTPSDVAAGLSRLKKDLLQRHRSIDYTIKNEDFKWLEKELDSLLPGFIRSIEMLGLSEREFNDALMIKTGLPTKDCAAILGTSPSSLSNSRRKLLLKHSPSGYEKWTEYVCSI